MQAEPGDYDVTLNQAQAPIVGQGNVQNNYFPSAPPSRRIWTIGLAVLITTGGTIAAVLATTNRGGTPGETIGPEVAPPVLYGHAARIHSASGPAIEERLHPDQAGDTAISAAPDDIAAQRWTFWYGSNQGGPDSHAVVLETDRTVRQGVNGGGAVLAAATNGTVGVEPINRSPAQFWIFHQAENRWYTITNQDRCLTAVQHDSPLQVRTCDGTPEQRWKVTGTSGSSTPTA